MLFSSNTIGDVMFLEADDEAFYGFWAAKGMLKQLDPFIGHLPLGRVHDEMVKPFINARRKQGVSNRTINIGLLDGDDGGAHLEFVAAERVFQRLGAAPLQLRHGGVVGQQLGVHVQLADAPRDELGELAAEVEDDDLLGHVHDDAHVVLDQEHRDADLLVHVEHEPRHLLLLLERHATEEIADARVTPMVPASARGAIAANQPTMSPAIAQRSGTTWFTDLLTQHPQVGLGVNGKKEQHLLHKVLRAELVLENLIGVLP